MPRAYYAVYSKVTHDLVALGVPMPVGREGPGHPGHFPGGRADDKGIRRLIVGRPTQFDLAKRQALSDLVGALYTLRLYADYHPSIEVADADAREARVHDAQGIRELLIGATPMPNQHEPPVIVERVRTLLADERPRGVHLNVRAARVDDDWLYVVVTPERAGERASEHARLMTQIERTLRAEGDDQVLLVPSVPEHDGLDDVPA